MILLHNSIIQKLTMRDYMKAFKIYCMYDNTHFIELIITVIMIDGMKYQQ